MNALHLCLHISVISAITLIALRYGIETMIAWLCLLGVVMNIFVLKQITLFGLCVTASDALAVGYLLGLNLIQEFFGRSQARKCVWISFFVGCAFIVLSQIHLRYQPNAFDNTQSAFSALLNPAPRIFLASIFSFLTVQFIDLSFFSFLRKKTSGKFLTARTILALILSQTLDTLLFSFIGLYGLVSSVTDIMILSLAVKGIVILLSAPFVALSKKVVRHVQV